MTTCPASNFCHFFNNKIKLDNIEIYKKKYCFGNNCNCARFLVAKFFNITLVPKNLLPNQLDKAEKLINEHCK